MGEGRSPATWLGNALAEALGDAGRALAGDAGAPRRVACGHSGIDYLGLLAARRHAQILRQLHVADPDHTLVTAPPWHLVNLITAHRGLLTPSPA